MDGLLRGTALLGPQIIESRGCGAFHHGCGTRISLSPFIIIKLGPPAKIEPYPQNQNGTLFSSVLREPFMQYYIK